MTCPDCSRPLGVVRVVLRSPKGEWVLCSACWSASAREAAETRSKLDELETKRKERSHG